MYVFPAQTALAPGGLGVSGLVAGVPPVTAVADRCGAVGLAARPTASLRAGVSGDTIGAREVLEDPYSLAVLHASL